MSRRYIIEDVELDPDRARSLYQAVLAWAAGRGERFVLHVRPADYTKEDELQRILALGGRKLPLGEHPGSRDAVQVEGQVDSGVIESLASMDVPERAIAGDLSPVEDLQILQAGRTIFAVYDYGRTQVLDLDYHDVLELKRFVAELRLDPDRIVIPAPKYVIGEV